MAEECTTRKITLREFKPESYKVWAMSTKATLSYNKLFDIVDGTLTDNGAIIRPIPAELNDQVEKWQHDHERARDAIIRCLPDAELLKLDDVQDSVTAIWKRLSNEYGRASNLEYVRASNDLTNLKIDEKTTINDHINKFEQLVHDVNYNKPSDTKNMEESVVNLMFLNTSVMVDKISSDKWETFINAKGPQLETMSTQQLYAEVRVNASRIKPVEPVPNEVKALKTELQSLQSLSTRFDDFQRNNDNGEGRRRRDNSRNDGRNNGDSNNSGRTGRNNKSRRRYPYDTNKSCELHGRGHSTEECNTLKRQAREQQSSGNNQQRNNYGDYQPNLNNRQFIDD